MRGTVVHRYYRLRKRDWKPLTWAIERARALRVIVCDWGHLHCTVPHHSLVLACMAWPGVQTYLCLNLAAPFLPWIEGTLTVGSIGSAKSRRCRVAWWSVWTILSINDTPVGYLLARSSEHSVKARWCVEDLETTYPLYSIINEGPLIMAGSLAWPGSDGPSLQSRYFFNK